MSTAHDQGHAAARCIDGNRTSGCQARANDANPWLKLDYGPGIAIHSMKVYNRKDCCQNLTEGAQISIRDSNGKTLWTDQFVGTNSMYTFNTSGTFYNFASFYDSTSGWSTAAVAEFVMSCYVMLCYLPSE